ncbi:MAG: DNA-binding protein [Gammaproteobacteria bacterium]|nr:DNA-binding protein [Gammaproteobacteria bacterium]MBK81712.1 DNA-binding protein [Gammaproteobacteria bacterium]
MRHQGRINTWQDDRGFGFITPDAGGQRVFVHIKSFTKRGRRPSAGAAVTYLVRRDRQGRLQAAQVAFANAAPRVSARPDQVLAVVIAAAALAGVGFAALMGWLPIWVPFLYTGMSLFTFLIYAHDKAAARRGRWRARERRLQALALVGGWPGALVAQRWLRHKSRKTSFQVSFWLAVTLNCAALVWLYLGLPLG